MNIVNGHDQWAYIGELILLPSTYCIIKLRMRAQLKSPYMVVVSSILTKCMTQAYGIN